MRTLLFFAGLLIPMVSFSADPGHADIGIADRVIGADFFVVGCILIAVLKARLVTTTPAIFYIVALTVAFWLGIYNAPVGNYMRPLASYLALVMAFGYFLVGLYASDDRKKLYSLILGMMVGVGLESIVVIHDYFLPGQWFPDALAGRVRGTFRASGQLGAYGFAMTGILLAFGRECFDRPRMKWVVLFCAMLTFFFIVAASRRSGMGAAVACLLFYLAFNLSRAKLPLVGVVPCLALLLYVGIVVAGGLTESSFVAKRISHATKAVGDDGTDHFIAHQANYVWSTKVQWLPLGYGTGMPRIPDPSGPNSHELHNGHLSILVELGVFGLLSFYALILGVLWSCWTGKSRLPVSVRIVLVSFLLSSAAFMIHNRLHRDRSFMMFLGIAAGVSTLGISGKQKTTAMSDPYGI